MSYWVLRNGNSLSEPILTVLLKHELTLEYRNLLTVFLVTYFPAIAAKYQECNEYWQARSGGAIRTIFSLFFMVTVNASLGERVKTFLHRDRKNLAIGVCCLFIFGVFSLLVFAPLACNLTLVCSSSQGFLTMENKLGW